MLVAFGLTFAVLAAMVASAALVPTEPLAPTAAEPVPAPAGAPLETGLAPSVAPSSASTGTPPTSTSAVSYTHLTLPTN